MTAPNVPLGPTGETETDRRARLRTDMAKIQAAIQEGRLPQEAMARYVERERITPEMEMAAMPLSTGEKVGGAGRALYQGASFNFGDELMGAVRGITDDFGSSPGLTIGEGIADERTQLDAFRAAHPKTALGLELGGGLATGIGAAKVLGGAPRAILASGVGGGAIAGAGAGEGLAGRAVGAGLGATIGAGLGAAGSAIANSAAGRAAGRGSRSLMDFLAEQAGNSGNDVAGLVDNLPPRAPQQYPGMDAPKTYSVPAQRAASRAFGSPENFNAQRSLLDELERQGMGADALAMNVGDDQTVRAVRAAANQPGSTAGQTVNERLARQGGALGEAVPADIGTVTGMGGTPGPLRVQEMIAERSGRARPLYEKAREAGDIYPERTNRPTPSQSSALASVDDAKLHDELERLMDIQSREEGMLAGLDESPEMAEYRGMSGKGMREDRRGVLLGDKQIGDINRDMALERGRVQQRQRTIDALKAEIERRAPAGPAFLDEVGDEAALGFDAILDAPLVRSAIAQAKAMPQFANLPDTDIRVLDKVYKNIGGKLRAAERAGDGALAHDLGTLRAALLTEITERNPAYGEAVRTFAGDSELLEGFETGLGLPGKPVGTATVALRETGEGGREAMRAGHVTALQQRAGERASNADLGDLAQFRDVARAAVGTPAARQQFIELHGQEQYDALLARLRPKIQAAAQNLAARGNSTTAKQLLDALAFGDDATLDALTSLAGGSPASAARRFVGQKLVGPLDRAYRLGTGQTAGETADILTTRGTGNIRSLLDMLEELGQADASRRAAVAPVTGAVGRTVTPEMRGNPR